MEKMTKIEFFFYNYISTTTLKTHSYFEQKCKTTTTTTTNSVDYEITQLAYKSA